jgi:hypothetical protein
MRDSGLEPPRAGDNPYGRRSARVVVLGSVERDTLRPPLYAPILGPPKSVIQPIQLLKFALSLHRVPSEEAGIEGAQGVPPCHLSSPRAHNYLRNKHSKPYWGVHVHGCSAIDRQVDIRICYSR